MDASQEDIRAGAGHYNRLRCYRCHGGGPVVPNLWYSSKEVLSRELFSLIVYDGVYAKAKGMPSFGDRLTKEQVEQLRAFVVSMSRNVAGPRPE